MKTIDVVQGTPEWLAIRAKYRTASEAPAMMGEDSNVSRSKMLGMKATGGEREFSEWVQENVLDHGHAVEALARPIAEKIVGAELYPATVTDDNDYLLASLDGMTMDDAIIFEHKQWNAQSAAEVRENKCPEKHYWQVQQALLITGAEKCLFMVSDGTEEHCVWMWVKPNRAHMDLLMAGWRQFDEDLANHKPTEFIPAAVAEPIQDLPALTVEISGRVLSTNLAVWQDTVKARIQAINTDLQDDNDFATAESTVKFLEDGEKRLAMVKSQAQAQAVDIDTLFRSIDAIAGEMRAKRLELDKLVKARKESIRSEILLSGRGELRAHIDGLNKRLGKPYMPDTAWADFAGSMKGKRTVKSLRDAVGDELASAKINSSACADRIQINLNSLRELAADHALLFADTAQLVLKDNDSLVAIIKQRIAEHEAAEAKRKADEAAAQAVAVPAPVAPSPAIAQADAQGAAGERAAAHVSRGSGGGSMLTTGRMHDLIDEATKDMSVEELRVVLEAAKEVRARRSTRAAA
jgi:putative phage-type endonuclease